MGDDQRSEGDAHLGAYLNEHLLGSEGGLRAFHAAARTWAGTPHEATLLALADEIAVDRRALTRLIQRLGHRPAAWKRALTGVLRATGELNPVNLLRLRGGSMAQLELDLLIGAVRAKGSMWEALLEFADDDPRLDRAELAELARRADDQIARLRAVSHRTVRERFGPSA